MIDHRSIQYEDELIKLIKSDDDIKHKFKILAYLPGYCFEADSIIDGESVIETYDVFKVRRLDNNRECFFCYSDYLSYKFVNINTIKKYLRQYKIV